MRMRVLLVVTACALAGCAFSPAEHCGNDAPTSRFISCVESFEPGPGAGFGQDRFPEVVFGPPVGGGMRGGSLDVVSLGRGGTITVGFGGGEIVDGDGPDLLVFENAFYVGGNTAKPFAELGEVSVSEDGVTWATFPCDHETFEGCAGWHAVLSRPDNGVSPLDPRAAGGDPFDLRDIGVSRAKLVRVRDLSSGGAGGNAGFDLDAMAIVNPAEGVSQNEAQR